MTQNNNLQKAEHKVDRLWDLLNDMEQTDDDKLFRRIMSSVKSGIARHRRRMLAKYAAALLLPAMVAGGIFLYTWRGAIPDVIISQVSGEVTFTMPDRQEIILGRQAENAILAENDDVIIQQNEGMVFFRKKDGKRQETEILKYGTVSVPRGTQYNFTLCDGTRVWLNSDSKLRFPIAFKSDERTVVLEGEGYFEVTPDKNKPFVVEVTGQKLTVLGTAFNLYAYPNERVTYTTLVSGSVELLGESNENRIILKPGEQAKLTGGIFDVRSIDASEVTSWRSNRFVFDENTLDEVMIKLSRWYNFEYSYEDVSTKNLIFKGSIPIYEDMSRVLRVIESMGIATFEQNGNQIKVKIMR